MATGWRHLPETILQLMVIGWNDFPGDSAGLGGWPPCGTILQLAVMGWKAELPWEPRVILSLTFGRVGVRSPVVRPELWPPADLPISALTKPRRKRGECISVESYRCKNTHPVQDSRDNVEKKILQCEVILFKRINMCVCVYLCLHWDHVRWGNWSVHNFEAGRRPTWGLLLCEWPWREKAGGCSPPQESSYGAPHQPPGTNIAHCQSKVLRKKG